jgi:hypothetical protein
MGYAIGRKGESSVEIRRCPATVSQNWEPKLGKSGCPPMRINHVHTNLRGTDFEEKKTGVS